MPFWVGAVTVGGVLFPAMVFASYLVAGVWGDLFPSQQNPGVLFDLIAGLSAQFAAVHAARRLEQLRKLSESLSEEAAKVNLQLLYRLRGILPVWILGATIVGGAFVVSGFPANYSLLQRVLMVSPYAYWWFFMATFIWIWMYSMYKVYRIGKLPMKLAPFTEDRFLGLKPFGAASLRLTAIYIVVFSTASLPSVIVGIAPLPGLLFIAIFFLLAPILFLLPLLPLHAKLLAAKRELSAIVGPRYTLAFDHFRKGESNPSDEKTVIEFVAIDKIQRDIQQIHSWPLDTGILVRLTAVILSVIAIMITKILSVVFRV